VKDWETHFGFSDPYSNQGDAIERIIETAEDAGYLAMEGPCGTGKTMAALTAASYLIRESNQFENAIVATPVKQQRQQFVEDLRILSRFDLIKFLPELRRKEKCLAAW
jgi:DNA excision repair protein ERCC-2